MVYAYTAIVGGKLCMGKQSINKPLCDVKHRCDSDIIMEHCYSDMDSEEG